jgi:hypothetical protein
MSSALLKKAVEWDVINQMPCVVRLLKTTQGSIESPGRIRLEPASVREPDASQKVLEAGVRTQRIEPRAHSQILQLKVVRGVCLLEPREASSRSPNAASRVDRSPGDT